jgi:uncharacterized protein YfaS (alpha-2-macroglobulin family)
MQTRKQVILTLILIALTAIGFAFSLRQPTPKPKQTLKFMSDNYEKLWREVDSLDRLGQPKSALEIVEQIGKKADADQNAPQIIKTTIYENRYLAMLEEDGLPKAINRMTAKMQTAEFPVRPILQSMLAQAYSEYFNNNSWQMRNRTTTVDFKNDDILTWSEAQFVQKSIELYQASIKDERLKQVQLADFQAIINNFEGSKLRETLYDLLAHRAVDYFFNETTYLTRPAYQFVIDDARYFSAAREFVRLDLSSRDTASLKRQALEIYQDLINLYLKSDNLDALADVDLKRLFFVSNNYNETDRKVLLKKALEQQADAYGKSEFYTEIQFQIAQMYFETGNNYDRKKENSEGKWDLKKAFEIADEAAKKYPNSIGAGQCRNLMRQMTQKELSVAFEQVISSDEPILAVANFRNINKTYGKIVRVTHEQVREWQREGSEVWLPKLTQLPAVQTFSLDLPNDGDLRQHDLEFKMDGLKLGLYYVLLSDDKDFKYQQHGLAAALLTVSDLAFAHRKGEDEKNVFILTNRKSGAPLKDVEAEFFVYDYNLVRQDYAYKSVGKQRSDAMGFIRTNFSDRQNSYQVRFSKGNDLLYLNDSYSNYNYSYNERKSITTHLFLDRAIHRPGQTVYFKGLSVENIPNQKVPKIVKGEKVKAVFLDANYQQVAQQEFTTNEFGTFSGSFTAPQGGLTGLMTISVTVGGHNATKSLRVEEYKRPKFEAKFEPIAGSFKLDEAVQVVGKATAYAGNSIDGAVVKYRVTRQAYFPYWRWWYWGENPYNVGVTEIKNGSAVTDENGTFKIDFTAAADKTIAKSSSPFFVFTVYADVTDITGETHSTQTEVRVSHISLEVDIEVAEMHNRDDLTDFVIQTKNLSGTFEAAKGTVKIERLQTPSVIYKNRFWQRAEFSALQEKDFKKVFPNYAYGEEDLTQNWAVAAKVLDKKFDTESDKKLSLDGCKSWQQGRYRVTLKTQDKFGNNLEQVKEFTLFAPTEKSVPTNEAFWFNADKTVAEPNEIVKLRLGSAHKTIHVLYEVEHDGKILQSKWATIDGKEEFSLPILEEYRGNVHYHLFTVQDGRFYSEIQTVAVPWSNKDLKIEYATFRDKLLPGEQEEWQIKLSGAKGDKVAAEMLATMYDASLDAFAVNNWSASFFGSSYARRTINAGNCFGTTYSSLFANSWQPEYESYSNRGYPTLNWFGFSFYSYNYYSRNAEMYELDAVSVGATRSKMKKESARPAPAMSPAPNDGEALMAAQVVEEEAATNGNVMDSTLGEATATAETTTNTDFSNVQVRTNLNETVFFYPNLKTDADGNIIISFKMNEALTKWKFLGFAHTEDLQHVFTQKEIVTQKDLMVVPNAPRFFRENDRIEFATKISNISDKDLDGTAKLMLFDALTMQPIDALLGNNAAEVQFSTKAGRSEAVSWSLKIPDFGVQAVTYRVVAKAGNFSDGEESTLPVLTNRMLLTETLPLPVRGGKTKEFNFLAMDKMNRSTTLKNHELTLEFTSNPAWYAVQSLPYLMEYPYECTEQVFSRYYANTLATSVANSSPNIQRIFNSWKNLTPDALKSNLSKNEELKYALLEETPWVLAAQNEAQQKQNIGLLFDLNRMSNELEKALQTLEKRQMASGGFPWFSGDRENWYITQYIVEGMGHLQYLGAIGEKSGLQKKQQAGNMLGNAVRFIDNEILKHYNDLLKDGKTDKKFDLNADHLDYMAIHYLYTRSFFLDMPIPEATKVAFDYYEGQAEKYWLDKGMYSEGMIALALHRRSKPTQAALIVKSLKERSLNNEEMGMYWKYPRGYWWYQAPIETHALMIEVFDEVANDAQAVDDLKVWLLKNRQTTHWQTTKATASAVYAMLMRGDNWLAETQEVEIFFGNQKFDQSQIVKEAGSGYFKTKLGAANIRPDMAKVKVVNPNKNPAWGALYWQYFEDFDKIETFEDTPLKLKKQLFKSVITDKGEVIQPLAATEKLQTGDKVIVRIELRVDRDMEYIHLKDTRASGFEPINVLSQYKWQGGLGYYESTRDAATNFFIGYLPKGTYVFEYPLRANLKGDFSNGITTIQCMYAPEFTSHSEGVRVVIE